LTSTPPGADLAMPLQPPLRMRITVTEANLAVLPVTGGECSDWSRPARVLSALAGLGIRPEWAARRRRTW
jgi:hypothetical protein